MKKSSKLMLFFELTGLLLCSWISSTSNAFCFEKSQNLNAVFLVRSSKNNRNKIATYSQGQMCSAPSTVFRRNHRVPVSKYIRFKSINVFNANSESKTYLPKLAVFSGLNSDQPNWQRKKQNFHQENARIKSVTRKLARVESSSISIELMVEDLSLEVCAY
jgi:hypothetical protein